MIFQTILYSIPTVIFYNLLNENKEIIVNNLQLPEESSITRYQDPQIV